MSQGQDRKDDRQLQTLERWKRLELESAQAEHVACQTREQERESERKQVLDAIAEIQDFARAQYDSGSRLSTDALLLASEFSKLQQKALADADTALKESQEAVSKAHSEVVSRSEHLFGIEKLRERRREEAVRGALQSAQTELDEQALLKLSSEDQTVKRDL